MNWIDGLKILAVTCGLLGVALNIKKERMCFLLWFVSNGCWALITRAEHLLCLQFGAFCIVCIYGFFAWRKKPIGKPKRITKPLNELVYQGSRKDRDTIHELKTRLAINDKVVERLLYKLRHTRSGPTKVRGIKKKR